MWIFLCLQKTSTACCFSRSWTGAAHWGWIPFLHVWLRTLLCAFLLVELIQPTLDKVRQEGLLLILLAPCWPAKTWYASIMVLLSGTLWCLPYAGTCCPRQGGRFCGAVVSMGLPAERRNQSMLWPQYSVLGLRQLYTLKWHMFEAWCGRRSLPPYQCPIVGILTFYRNCWRKVYLAAISACHEGINCAVPSVHPLAIWFLK